VKPYEIIVLGYEDSRMVGALSWGRGSPTRETDESSPRRFVFL
jgi:hypothetical protein